jgi:penicillin-binding protein 1A
MWSPRNYSGGYAGAVPLRRAMAASLNTVAVKLALEVGPENISRMAQKMGVRTPVRRDLTIALGSSEVTPMDQALGYATIARMGVPTDPVYLRRILSVDGQVVANAGDIFRPAGPDEEDITLPGGVKQRVLPAGVAYELADMMREVVNGGTARGAKRPGLDRAGKTGTTNDFLDAWFVGFTPQHTIAVWIGTDSTTSLGEKETGGKTALPAWVEIAEALGPITGDRFPVPDEAVLVRSDWGWVGLNRGSAASKALTVSDDRKNPLPLFRR